MYIDMYALSIAIWSQVHLYFTLQLQLLWLLLANYTFNFPLQQKIFNAKFLNYGSHIDHKIFVKSSYNVKLHCINLTCTCVYNVSVLESVIQSV